MTEHICHLIGHKFSQFQALSGHFVKKKNWKLFSSFLGFKVIYQLSGNNEPKRCYLPRNITNNSDENQAIDNIIIPPYVTGASRHSMQMT